MSHRLGGLYFDEKQRYLTVLIKKLASVLILTVQTFNVAVDMVDRQDGTSFWALPSFLLGQYYYFDEKQRYLTVLVKNRSHGK